MTKTTKLHVLCDVSGFVVDKRSPLGRSLVLRHFFLAGTRKFISPLAGRWSLLSQEQVVSCLSPAIWCLGSLCLLLETGVKQLALMYYSAVLC